MKLATKTAFAAALFSLAVGTGGAHAAPLGGIPGGDFESFPTNFPVKTNAAGEWNRLQSTFNNSAFSLATIVERNENNVLRLFQGTNNHWAAAYFTSNTATATDSAWEVGADIAWSRSTDQWQNIGASSSFRLLEGDHNSTALFGMRFNFQGLHWQAGTENGLIAVTDWPNGPGTADSRSATVPGSYNHNILGPDLTLATISYDPISGQAVGFYDGIEVFNVTTTTGLSVQTVRFENNPGGNWEPSEFLVDNVYAIPEPASLALLGAGSLLMLARRRRQMA